MIHEGRSTEIRPEAPNTLDNGSDQVLINVLFHYQRPTYMEMDLFMETDLLIYYVFYEK